MTDFFSFEPKRILCPLDFSELSDLAIKYAAVAAREYNATVPVFTVRQKTHLFIDVTRADAVPFLKRILCPSNISETAVTALRHAAALAERFGAVLTVLHIRETDNDTDISKDEEKLCAWIADTAKVQCEVKPMVRKGHAAEEIISYAGENKDDLIVLGARHQQFLEATFFGRTTELVVRHAPCPVLITPRFSAS